MSLQKYKIRLHAVVAIPITLIVIGALAMSTAAVVENLHFINATNQILSLVGSVRMVAADQVGFAQTPGEDIWADLEHAGQIATASKRANPWQGDMRVTAVTNTSMRIETNLPTHDCRRLALYFLELQPTELGLLSLEAEAAKVPTWSPIYPSLINRDRAIGTACGNGPSARLALLFKIR